MVYPCCLWITKGPTVQEQHQATQYACSPQQNLLQYRTGGEVVAPMLPLYLDTVGIDIIKFAVRCR